MLNKVLVGVFTILLFVSCGKKKTGESETLSDKTYFSIKQFARDQWNTYRGQPFGIEKFVSLNGKTDSVLTNAFDLPWSSIFQPFFESDISDPKFLGQYNFSSFKDDATYTLNLYYEAKDDKLFTRKLMISVDDVTAKVKSIYIETEGDNITRKLLYIPVKIISIQEFEQSAGEPKELRIEYRFLH